MDESHSKLNTKVWHTRIHTVQFIYIRLKSKQNYNQGTSYLLKGSIDWEEAQGILLRCLYYSISCCGLWLPLGRRLRACPRPGCIDIGHPLCALSSLCHCSGYRWYSTHMSLDSLMEPCWLLYVVLLPAHSCNFQRTLLWLLEPLWLYLHGAGSARELMSATGQPVATDWLVWKSESPALFPQDKTNSLHNYL